ncbi:MAG: polyprenyl diphosphate synthase [archaeon]
MLKKTDIMSKSMPKHIAITTEGKTHWAKINNKPLNDAYRQSLLNIKDIMKEQVKLNIPITTFYLLSTDIKDFEPLSELVDFLVMFFNELPNLRLVRNNKIKVSVLGKWYNMPGRVVEAIKKSIDGTQEYDNFFVNFCVNYDGQEEIVDACKLLARQVKAEKVDIESIDKTSIKENLYSSYLLPPEIIIKNGEKKNIPNFLLWDSVNSYTYYSGKLWPDFRKKKSYKRNKGIPEITLILLQEQKTRFLE